MSFQGARRPPMNFNFNPRAPPPRPGGPMMSGPPPPPHMRGPRPSLPQSQNKNRIMGQDDQEKPRNEKPPVTTVFVGSIAERAPDKLVRTLLQRCGNIVNWKRVQGADGKMQGFGFCEFEIPESTLRCVRLLNDWQIADKKLVVKVDDKTRKLLDEYEESHKQDDEDMKREDRLALAALDAVMREFSNDLRRQYNKGPEQQRHYTPDPTTFRPPIASGPKADEGLDDMPVDDDAKELINREINRFRLAYKNDEVVTEIKTTHKPGDKKDSDEKEKTSTVDKDENKESGDKKLVSEERKEESKHKEKEESRRRDRSRSRDREAERRRAREERDREKERERRFERERAERERSERERSERTRDRSDRAERDKERSDRSRTDRRARDRDTERDPDEDPDEKYERLRLERQLRDKEMAYQERLKNWEVRERKKIREFERERTRSEERKIEEKKEARRLREFLEDYNDDKDDVKYYKGSGLLRRQKEREKEAEADARDRQKEKEELEILRQKLVEEGHPDPDGEIHRQKNGRPQREPSPEPEVIKVSYNPEEEADPYNTHSPYNSTSNTQHNESKFRPVSDEDSQTSHTFNTGKRKLFTAAGKKLSIKDVFNNDDENDDGGPKKRTLKSIDEETKKSAAEQKKLAITRLIERIPTEKDELFKWPIDWSVLDQNLLKTRVQPWVNRKIADYIGEEEKTLTDFICQKVMSRSNAQSILTDVAMVLDDEAEVFVVKMWRLLVYETEAKKAGLMSGR